MRFPLTLSSPQERLVGERVVVKGIEIFGNFSPALFMTIRREVAVWRTTSGYGIRDAGYVISRISYLASRTSSRAFPASLARLD
jgi:hypothetical protein